MKSTERMQILEMVESGKVSVPDAIGLMSESENAPRAREPRDSGRWLRVRVTDLATGKRKVSVNLPLRLMKWGMALGSRFAPELEGLDIEDMMSDLDQYAEGRLIEVEDAEDNQRVEIFVE